MTCSKALRFSDTSAGINYANRKSALYDSVAIKGNVGCKPTAVCNQMHTFFNFSASNQITFHNWIRLASYEGTKSLRKSIVASKELSDNIEKVNRIGRLEFNWNGNNAEPFARRHLDKVRVLLMHLERQPEVFPTAADSIQLEYDGENGAYLEFQIYEDDNADVFCVDKQGAEMEWQVALNDNVINSIVRKFYE